MKTRLLKSLLFGMAVFFMSLETAGAWQKEFNLSQCKLLTKGRNGYFVLEPGHQLVLEGGDEKLQITVLDETKTVDGVVTRVVEEREWKNGALYEVARNYFAFCESTHDVFYFGEDVEFYKDGKVTGTSGSWLAGGNNKAGLIMPGTPKVGMKYYQEIAPDVAMDRAEIVSMDKPCKKMPAGEFKNCLKVKESSQLDFWASLFRPEYKIHAPGIGLVQDEDLVLTKYGFINASPVPLTHETPIPLAEDSAPSEETPEPK